MARRNESRQRLSALGTEPNLQGAIGRGLQAWQYDNSINLIDFPNLAAEDPIPKIMRRQGQAVWQCTFEGHWVLDWSDLQEDYYKKSDSRRSGKQWLAKVI